MAVINNCDGLDAWCGQAEKSGTNGAAALIRHIVFFTARSPDTLDAVCAGLERLGTIEHASHFEVTRNSKVDQISNEVDVVVYAEFADADALAAYKAHPTYAEATCLVRPLRELRLSADFEAKL